MRKFPVFSDGSRPSDKGEVGEGAFIQTLRQGGGGGGGSQTKKIRPFGSQFGIKVRGGSPGSATGVNYDCP